MKFLWFQDIQAEDTQSTRSSENEHIFACPLRTKRNVKRRWDEDDKKEEEAFHFLKVVAKELTTKDECTMSGQMVAFQIRKLNKRNQAIAKNRIQNCLFELEMEEMNTASSNQNSTVQLPAGITYFSSSSSASPRSLQSPATCSDSQPSTPHDQNTAFQDVQQYLVFDLDN